jgi:hypothetical protein
LACRCFWISTTEGAEFHFLNTAQFQLAGRGSEVALLKVEDIYCVDAYEDTQQYKIICSRLQRDKDGPLQELSIYPHRDSVHQDMYFALVYYIVMSGTPTDHVLPTSVRKQSIYRKQTNSKVKS